MKPVIIILTILLLSCCTEQKKYNRLTIYDEVLEQLFMKEYYYYFIEPNAYALRMDSLYWIGKISDERYRKILFDLRDRGIRLGKTCQVDYLDSLTASYSYTKDEFISYFLNNSTNTIKANFKDQHLNEIASTLFTKADFTSTDFKSKLIRVNKYKKERKYIWSNDVPVISFSEVHFNKSENHALVYFQYLCGGKCGRGWLLQLEKKEDHWKIIEYIETWVS